MTKISGFEIPRPIRLKALAARQRRPNDLKAMKLAANLEAAKFLVARAARRENDRS